jgi:hypothetical protein
MIDFDIHRCSRKCATTERELKAGEVCYSVLTSEGGEVVRRDYSTEAWQGPPDDAIGWWKSIVVDSNARRMHWAPSDVMLNYFQQLADNPAAEDTRYVLALLLVRRRILRAEGTETDPSGRELQKFYSPRQECEYLVPVVLPAPERVEAIQNELAQLLQTGAS